MLQMYCIGEVNGHNGHEHKIFHIKSIYNLLTHSDLTDKSLSHLLCKIILEMFNIIEKMYSLINEALLSSPNNYLLPCHLK